MSDYPYVYAWGNNSMRKGWKDKRCRILISGSMGSCLIEFEDGEQVNTSRRALRKAQGGK
jgi:hypothetical protein